MGALRDFAVKTGKAGLMAIVGLAPLLNPKVANSTVYLDYIVENPVNENPTTGEVLIFPDKNYNSSINVDASEHPNETFITGSWILQGLPGNMNFNWAGQPNQAYDFFGQHQVPIFNDFDQNAADGSLDAVRSYMTGPENGTIQPNSLEELSFNVSGGTTPRTVSSSLVDADFFSESGQDYSSSLPSSHPNFVETSTSTIRVYDQDEFNGCLGGPANSYTSGHSCKIYDMNSNGSVALDDFAKIQTEMSE